MKYIGSIVALLVPFAILLGALANEENEERALRDGRALQGRGTNALRQFFLGRKEYCHNLQNKKHETIHILWFLAFIHNWHKDTPGLCGESCAAICEHQECYDDFLVTLAGSDCQCLKPDGEYSARYKCGGNTVCHLDKCHCKPGFTGDPYSELGCTCTGGAANGCTKSDHWGSCETETDCGLYPTAKFPTGEQLKCARRSRSDDETVCCISAGICNNDTATCCTGKYVQGEACPSKSRNDCEGSLLCGWKSRLDNTYVCCPETFYPRLGDEPVCKPFF